ncbi:hypothetical protein BS17DRAFT_775303 [Gyrodon lividus]|nr:hypothetical protein BS17DRAFT_775303 [Gyrodon lividus]
MFFYLIQRLVRRNPELSFLPLRSHFHVPQRTPILRSLASPSQTQIVSDLGTWGVTSVTDRGMSRHATREQNKSHRQVIHHHHESNCATQQCVPFKFLKMTCKSFV